MLYSGAAAFVYPSKMEGFGMPPLEAAACGTNVILGPFHRDKMHQVFQDLAFYATSPREMASAMQKIAAGEGVDSKLLVERAKRWGADPRHGWNEVRYCIRVCGCAAEDEASWLWCQITP